MRPFRNPETQEQIDENYQWQIRQIRDVAPADREEGWQNTPAWCLDLLDFHRNYYDLGLRDYENDIEDPWAFRARIRRAPARDPEGMATNEKMMKMYKRINLDRLPEGPPIERDMKLPPFKVDYDSHEQIHQKLNGTVILIKNNPYVVAQTAEYEKGKFALLVSDREGNNGIVHYEDIADVRGIAPAYYTYRGQAYWFYRSPERQNKQGMDQRNTFCKPAGGSSSGARVDMLLTAFSQTRDIPFAANLCDLLASGANESLRLSNRVALYQTHKKGAPVGVEYMSRPLGLIINGACKAMDEVDLAPSWIHKDLARIGLQLVA